MIPSRALPRISFTKAPSEWEKLELLTCVCMWQMGLKNIFCYFLDEKATRKKTRINNNFLGHKTHTKERNFFRLHTNDGNLVDINSYLICRRGLLATKLPFFSGFSCFNFSSFPLYPRMHKIVASCERERKVKVEDKERKCWWACHN